VPRFAIGLLGRQSDDFGSGLQLVWGYRKLREWAVLWTCSGFGEGVL
jgi:hypothetical protein